MKDAAYDEFIDRLRAECDIVSILSEYVPLKKKGKNYWGCCPFHNENTPSVFIIVLVVKVEVMYLIF
jgi:DNA primase